MGMRSEQGRTGRRRAWGGAAAVLAAAVGVGLVVVPGAASAAPQLPPISPEDLVSSVMTAQPGAFNGTVAVTNKLGLPAVPGLPQAANGGSSARVWSAGDGKGRLSLPTPDGERTFVADGTNRWSYDSQDRTVTKAPEQEGGKPDRAPDGAGTDPAAAAKKMIGALRTTSTVSVDGTAEVAGRAVYQLVLAPKPTERTLLREVRVSVDAEKRMPLQLSVLANGSPDPALQIGFSDVTFGPQDPALFRFSPPPGSTVRPVPEAKAPAKPRGTGKPDNVKVVGDGWDTVVVARAPKNGAPGATPDARTPGDRTPGNAAPGAPDLSAIGTPVSGPWAPDARSAPRSAPRSSPATAGSPRAPSRRRC